MSVDLSSPRRMTNKTGDVPTTSREQLAAVEAKAEAAAPSYTFSQAVAGRPSPAPAAC